MVLAPGRICTLYTALEWLRTASREGLCPPEPAPCVSRAGTGGRNPRRRGAGGVLRTAARAGRPVLTVPGRERLRRVREHGKERDDSRCMR